MVDLDPVIEEPPIFHEEDSVTGATSVVEAVAAASSGIGGEAGAGDFVPGSFGVTDPLVAIEPEALLCSEGDGKIFEKDGFIRSSLRWCGKRNQSTYTTYCFL